MPPTQTRTSQETASHEHTTSRRAADAGCGLALTAVIIGYVVVALAFVYFLIASIVVGAVVERFSHQMGLLGEASGGSSSPYTDCLLEHDYDTDYCADEG